MFECSSTVNFFCFFLEYLQIILAVTAVFPCMYLFLHSIFLYSFETSGLLMTLFLIFYAIVDSGRRGYFVCLISFLRYCGFVTRENAAMCAPFLSFMCCMCVWKTNSMEIMRTTHKGHKQLGSKLKTQITSHVFTEEAKDFVLVNGGKVSSSIITNKLGNLSS